MFGIVNFEVFLMASILLNLTPGTDTMYIVSRSMSQGRAAGMYSVLGIATGSIGHTLLAAFGLSVILTQSAFLFTTIKIIGAIYLAYLGIQMLRAKRGTAQVSQLPHQSNRKIFWQGCLTNLTNPKVAIFYLAFLPQFVDPNTTHASFLPFILLGLTFTLTGTIWCLMTAYFTSIATQKLRTNSTTALILNKCTGIIFIAMSIQLFQTKQT